MHVLRDAALCSSLRKDLIDSVEPGHRLRFDLKKLEKHPLLLSMYAETLRFGVEIHVPRAAPPQNLSIGKMLIPQAKLAVVNSWLAPNDEKEWNTRNNTFPLSGFWAQRFLVDPMDPSSGPVRSSSRKWDKSTTAVEGGSEIRFSKDGLEGSWIPFEGSIFSLLSRYFANSMC